MSNIFGEDRETQIIGGGYGGYGYGGGGYGGSWCIIIIFFVIAWLLFRDGHKDGYNGGAYGMPYPYPPYPYGNCNSPLDCKIPMAPDMSNCEVDKDLWKVDADLKECCCKEIEATHCEGEKTRALIEQNYIQDLRDQLAAANSEKAALKSEMFTEKKIDQVLAGLGCLRNDVDKQFCKTDAEIAALSCEIPKRPPIFCEGTTPNTHHIDCHDFPRRRGFDGCGFDGCCA